jgi:ferritin-like metal-binding protein YciE
MKGILDEGEMVMHKKATDEAMDATIALYASRDSVTPYEVISPDLPAQL